MVNKLDNSTPGYPEWPHSKQIRAKYAIPAWYKIEESLTDKETSLPNWLVHEYPSDKYDHEGGTTALCLGGKRAGKTTFGLWTAVRCMEINDEAVIWRGASGRSEWLPLKYWTRLLLPSSVPIEAYWDPFDHDEERYPADLEEVVAPHGEVVYYDDLADLRSKMEQGKFHVVYPDPEFRGCNEVMQRSEYSPHDIEYVPRSMAAQDDELEATSVITWWVAFIISRVEDGPFDFTQLIFDETADLAPDSARADLDQMWEKVVALRHATADADKYLFSILWLAHHEENLHEKARRPIQWRIDMPDGSRNPVKGDQPPVGFTQIPMKYNMMGKLPKGSGKALVWNEAGFTRLKYEDFPDAEEDQMRKLKIEYLPPDSDSHTRDLHARVSESAGADRGVGDD